MNDDDKELVAEDRLYRAEEALLDADTADERFAAATEWVTASAEYQRVAMPRIAREVTEEVLGGGIAKATPYAALHAKVWDGQVWQLTEADAPPGRTLEQMRMALATYARRQGWRPGVRQRGDLLFVQRRD